LQPDRSATSSPTQPSGLCTPVVGTPDWQRRAAAMGGDAGEVDALPVLADGARVVRRYPAVGELQGSWRSAGIVIPAVQAAAAAAGGFVAGAAVVGLVHRRQRHSAALSKGRRAGRGPRRAGRGGRAAPTAGELVQIVGSRSLLVDVHLLGGRG
jgi:hypothetical protein